MESYKKLYELYISEGKVVGQDIKKIVDLEEWQDLRKSLVGKWKSDPDGNLNKLKKFGGDLTKLSNRRLRILQNYVTGSGFRIGIISSSDITEFTKKVQAEVQKRKDNKEWE